MNLQILHWLDKSNNFFRLFVYQILGKFIKTESTKAAIEIQKEILTKVIDKKNQIISVDVQSGSFLHKNDYIIRDIFGSRGFIVKNISPIELSGSQLSVHDSHEYIPKEVIPVFLSPKNSFILYIFFVTIHHLNYSHKKIKIVLDSFLKV